MSERHVPDNQKTASSYISSGIGRSCLPKMSCIFPQNDRHILGVLIQFERETWERDLRASGVRKTLHAVTTTGQWRSTCLIASDFSLPSSSQISYQPRIGQLIYAWEWPFFFFVFSSEQHFLPFTLVATGVQQLPLFLLLDDTMWFIRQRQILEMSMIIAITTTDCQLSASPRFFCFYFNSNRERDCWQWPLWSCWKSTLTHFGCPASGPATAAKCITDRDSGQQQQNCCSISHLLALLFSFFLF